MDFRKAFSDNLILHSCKQSIDKHFKSQKITPKNLEVFLKHLELVIPYFCQHPQNILESIKELNDKGLEYILKNLHDKTQNNVQVWNGTIGEAIATYYILSSTDYKIPVFKLRFSPNRKMAMHGDDILGFKINIDGRPQKLLGDLPKEFWKETYEQTYRIRVGNYRVIYQIKDQEMIVLILSAVHRKDAY